jgi:heat shock protein HslJ|tara:strand:- start:425 stop:1117 length:693 start_codon:yes stop_codon:yes gene_type:complete
MLERRRTNLAAVVLKLHFADLTCRTAFLLALMLAAPALGQEASNIDSFEAATVSLRFPSSDGDYHLVQASRDLKKWVIVGQYPGNGQVAWFKDLRSQLGETHFYRVVTKSELFQDGLLDREWKLVAFHEADEITRPKTGRKHTLNLARNGNVTGRNDCNSYFGTFTLEKGNWLKFGKGFDSTEMLCMPGSLDFKFFEMLHMSKGFEVDGNKLKLFYGDNAERWMEFSESD